MSEPRTSPAAIWSFGLGVVSTAVLVASVVLGSLPGNPGAVAVVTVLFVGSGLCGAVSAGLGAAAVRQIARDRELRGTALALVGLVLGVLVALPIPWFAAATLGWGLSSGFAFVLAGLLTSLSLLGLASVVYRLLTGE